jgi:hypothetical protein
MKHHRDKNTALLRNWLRANPKHNRETLHKALRQKGPSPHGIAHLLSGHQFGKLRSELVTKLEIKWKDTKVCHHP